MEDGWTLESTLISRVGVLALCALASAGACEATQLAPLPLTVSVEASRTTAAPQDSISFVIRAAGGTLLLLELDYGDTALDRFSPSGARTASVTFRHAYAARGAYTVTATVTDVQAGQKRATVDVRVN